MNDPTGPGAWATKVIEQITRLDPELQAIVVELLDQFLAGDKPVLDDFNDRFPLQLLLDDDGSRELAGRWLRARRPHHG